MPSVASVKSTEALFGMSRGIPLRVPTRVVTVPMQRSNTYLLDKDHQLRSNMATKVLGLVAKLIC